MLDHAWRRLFKNPYRFSCVLLCLVLALGGYVALEWCLADPLRITSHSVDASEDENVNFRRDIASQLVDITLELKGSSFKATPRTLLKLNKIISQLDPQFALSTGAILTKESNLIPDTCGEEFKNTRYGSPFYEKGFEISSSCNVDKKPPLSSLLTILILDQSGDPSILQTILKGVEKYDVHLPVYIASFIPKASLQNITANFKNVRNIKIQKKEVIRPGKIWNYLVAKVKTPYVLLAKDLFYFNSLARLERQIFVISNSTFIEVAGGAFRNESGHWKVGCHVSRIKNYFLEYTEGYQYSAMDCMFCDHLEGPFIAKTRVLKNIRFKDELTRDVIFEDWFLRIKQENILVMNCPDVMYFKQGPVEATSALTNINNGITREAWLAFAIEWQVDKIVFPLRVSLEFTCEELKLTCDATRWYKALLIPPCCLVQIKNALKVLDDFSRQNGIDYEVEAGSLLGAVKLRSFLPWDKDGDITFRIDDYNTFYENSDYFSDKGFSLSKFKENKYFRLNTPETVLEMWGSSNLSTSTLPPGMWNAPTRLKMLGMWVRGEWNPGLFARNRYGPDYLKHVQHWGVLGMVNSWVTYKPGSWKTCVKKAHHGCLDHYPTDGNIGFYRGHVP